MNFSKCLYGFYLQILLLEKETRFSIISLAGLFGDSSKVTAKEGQNATLPCTATVQGGIWQKTSWFKGTQKVISIQPGGYYAIYSQRKKGISVVGQQSIRLTAVDRSDHGNYSCKALYLSNGEIKFDKEDVLLLVKGKFKPYFNNNYYTYLINRARGPCWENIARGLSGTDRANTAAEVEAAAA